MVLCEVLLTHVGTHVTQPLYSILHGGARAGPRRVFISAHETLYIREPAQPLGNFMRAVAKPYGHQKFFMTKEGFKNLRPAGWMELG